MSIPQFDNPLERLAVLPNVINWKSVWVDGDQYFMNDVVVEPVSTASYILTGATSILSTVNPASDPLWSVLAGTTQGIVSVNAGAGISVTGPPINPFINNTGILDLQEGNAIIIDKSSPQNPIISCTAFTQIIAGAGITVAGIPDPIITNDGVRTLTQGAGIVISATAGDVSISNSGIIDILEGTGVTISLGQTPTISNTGVISITPGDNISNSGTATDVILNALVPSLSKFCDPTVMVLTTAPYPIPASTASVTPGVGNVSLAIGGPSTFFSTTLANGGTLEGVFMIDMTGFTMLYTGAGAVDGFPPYLTEIQFVDATTAGGPFYYTADSVSANRYSAVVFPFPFSLGVIKFVVADARATGMRQVDSFNIINNMSSEVELLGGSGCYATYYPQGVQ